MIFCVADAGQGAANDGSVLSILTGLRLGIQPDKTCVGPISKGFDFVGYHFLDGTLSAAERIFAEISDTPALLFEQKGIGIKLRPLVIVSRAGKPGFGLTLMDLNYPARFFR